MAIAIREADLATDKELLLDILLRNRDHGDNDRRRARFEWSYYHNPYGRPRAWLAIEPSSSRTIGMSAAFPRRIRINDEVVTGWNTGDFSIDQDFRTLGVAIKLRRVVQKAVNCGEMPFLYAYPVDRMRVVLERTGHQAIGKFTRHGMILRTDELIEKFIGRGLTARVFASLANFVAPAQWSHRFASKQYQFHLQARNHFGPEFDDLFERVRERFTIMTVRDSRFLHWRFVENPLEREFRIFRLEQGGRLQGYAVLGFVGPAVRILDLLVDGDHLAIRTLLLNLIRWARANRVCTLAIRALPTSNVLEEARPLGFLFQDHKDAGVVVYARNENLIATVTKAEHWFMTQADRDV